VLQVRWTTFCRSRIPVPNIFAAGDVRSGSVKRCAAAVGEGGMAVAGVQIALAAIG